MTIQHRINPCSIQDSLRSEGIIRSWQFLAVTFFVLTALNYPVGAAGRTFYIANGGIDHSTCVAERNSPWQTLDALWERCLSAGDEIIFLPGQYSKEVLRNGDLSVNKNADASEAVTISGEGGRAADWPVKFIGEGFKVTYGGPVTIRGIEFSRPSESTTTALISIGSSNVRLEDNYIHSTAGVLDDILADPKKRLADCIYAPALSDGPVNLTINNNIIKNCSQDAIDSGAKNITITNNIITSSLQIQLKGGAQNVILENNYISSMVYGVVGGAMACPFYCGSGDLVKMNVPDRFNARNLIIRNNSFKDIARGWIVNFTGYQDVQIVKNNIDLSKSTHKQEMLSAGEWGSQYMDEIAEEYCSQNRTQCLPCQILPADGGFCAKIYLPPKDIMIKENTIVLADQPELSFVERGLNERAGICFSADNTTNEMPTIIAREYDGDNLLELTTLSVEDLNCESEKIIPSPVNMRILTQ